MRDLTMGLIYRYMVINDLVFQPSAPESMGESKRANGRVVPETKRMYSIFVVSFR